ncbi:MAG: apolipoprotein N-acyltransferase, partial [Actinobacteria bacterium]|nr:apolipoprotein N-acyltransferase [Actinomycetota bacterium]
MKFYIKFILILISGALLSLSFYGPGFLAWFCLVPYFAAAHYSSLKQTVFFSFVLGLIYFAGVTYWFTQYSFIFWLPIIGYLTIFTIFFGIILYFIYSKINWPALRIVLISAFWLALEFLRNRTFLAFPWGVLAYSQHSYLPIMQMTKITGIYGVSLLIILFNSAIVESIINFVKIKKINFKYLLTIVCLVVVVVIAGFINISIYKKNFENKDYRKINIAMVQTNISFDEKFERDSGVLIPDPYSGKNYFKDDTELVVFPESIIWGSLEHNKTFKEWAAKTIKKENLYLIMGQILWDDKENYYNSVVLYSPQLDIVGRYNK